MPRQAVSNVISGGVFFNAVIQGKNITAHLPAQITPALSGLPRTSPTFTGREYELEILLHELAPNSPHRSARSTVAVVGMAGVGKTELALQAAAQAMKKAGWFPGGVLFVDLVGYDNERCLTSEHALDGLLRALAIPVEHIPPDSQDRARLYHSVLAAYVNHGQRILVIIDNASSASQVIPLLPTDGTTGVLVTSRHTIDIGARLLDLDILDRETAVNVIRLAVKQARGGTDRRIDNEPQHVGRIVELCGYLPLALRIAAALLADNPMRPVASLAQALSDTHTRLVQLKREERAVRAAFDLSYQQLASRQAYLFRLLSINPGLDFSTECASQLINVDFGQAEELVQDLARAHLVETSSSWGRWRFHDLVRLYAADKERDSLDRDEHEAALGRLLDHYLTNTFAAVTHLDHSPWDTSIIPEVSRFPGRTQALKWLDVEYSNLTAAMSIASSHPAMVYDLAIALAPYFLERRRFDDWTIASESALQAARKFSSDPALWRARVLQAANKRTNPAFLRGNVPYVVRKLGSDLPLGTALANRGAVLAQERRFEESIAAFGAAVKIFRRLGDKHSQAGALSGLGSALEGARRFKEAVKVLRQAAATFGHVGDRRLEAGALHNLGNALTQLRQFDAAVGAHQQAAEIFVELDDRHGEGMALIGLGCSLQEVRRFHDAVSTEKKAANIFTQRGDRYLRAKALNNLGNALFGLGLAKEGLKAQREAAALYRALGEEYDYGKALNNLGGHLMDAEQFNEAISVSQEAAAILGKHGDRHARGMALNNLGGALRETGRFAEAIVAHEEDLEVCREVGDRNGEGLALLALGAALGASGRFEEAISACRDAAVLLRKVKNPAGRRTALQNLELTQKEMKKANGS